MRSIFTVLSLLPAVLTSAAGADAGILFRSYDVPAEHRTSMVLTGTNGNALTFKDSLSFSFSLKTDPDKGKFGYVFRLAVDEMLSVDFLLSPEDGKPVYCITADHQNIVAVDGLVENVEEWNDIYVDLVEKGDTLVLSLNDSPVVSLYTQRKRHKARLFFGKVDEPGLVTTDVAPMSVADLRISCDGGRKRAAWMLSGSEDLTSGHGIEINVRDPVFISGLGDRWTKIWSAELPSTSYICISRDTSEFYIISSDRIIRYDIAGDKEEVWPYSTDIDLGKVTGEFMCLSDGTLCYADMETGKMIRYDKTSGDWTDSNVKDRVSVHLHHNVVYLDSTCVQMFGYGQHRYSSEIFVWAQTRSHGGAPYILEGPLYIDGLAPRYLAGAASLDGKIYVLGGKGNVSGQQELGTQFYDTFSEIDPSDGTFQDLWHNPLLKSMVPAKDIVFTDGGNFFLALLYNPEANESSLQLTRFSTADGKSEALLQPLPYRFTDIYSDVRLCYNKERDVYLAILCYRSDSGQDKAEVYILGNPVTSAAGGRISNIALPLIILAVLSMTGYWILRREKRRSANKEAYPEGKGYPEAQASQEGLEAGQEGGTALAEPSPGPGMDTVSEPRKDNAQAESLEKDYSRSPVDREDRGKEPGIHLLGGFHVFDTAGNEITSSFSPILIQLFSILVLYTAEKGGVSNAALKELLWPDKSDDRFNNNKGVNITKLRKLLASVGNIQIVTEGGLWMVRDESGLCDYMIAREMLHRRSALDIITAAMYGPLLPEYHFEWLDSFKSEYADLVLSRLADISRQADMVANDPIALERTVQIADARLKFDSLDEEAVRMKCHALISMGKAGTANAVFGHFSEEYAAVMGEPFGLNFSDFLKNKSH